MAAIQTYVFLDLETTGLPREELNKTKITELSMVVVKRCHILETRAGQLPRVQHKLTMCFNPGRTIHPGATEASGLDNDLLEFETMFDIRVFNTIKSFLACQEKPLCLIAENGHTFDFPILKNHFEKLNANLDEDVMCADSLHAFYDILNVPCSSSHTGLQCVLPEQSNDSITNGDLNKMLNNEDKDEVDCSYKDNGIIIVNESVIKDDESPLSIQSRNENTPKSKTFKVTPKKIREVRRKLFYDKNQKPDQSYKLKSLYERILRRPGIDAHRAENDCVMTAEIATAKAKEFVDWIDNNHCAFSEVKAMSFGVPLGLLTLTGLFWGCTNPFIRQGTKGLRDVTATTRLGQAWAEISFLLGNWKYVLPWLVNQAGSLVYLAAVRRAPLSVAVPTANGLAFAFTAITGATIGAEEPLDRWSVIGIVLIMGGTAMCCYDKTS